VTGGAQAAAPGRNDVGRAAAAAIALALIVAAPAARVVVEGSREERASETALAAGDMAGATVHARRAAMAYVPFAPHVGRAYQRLRTIALDAETRGNPDAALFAWRAVRSASIGSSWLLPAAARERRAADTAIARLSAMTLAASLPAHRAIPPDTARRYAQMLATDAVPARGRIAVLLGGLAALVAAVIFGINGALSADGRIDLSKAKGAAALAIVGCVGWIVGLLIV
jgi:hypothetical protein